MNLCRHQVRVANAAGLLKYQAIAPSRSGAQDPGQPGGNVVEAVSQLTGSIRPASGRSSGRVTGRGR